MISIDHLRLTLPAGWEDRAGSVARLVAEELAALPQAGLGSRSIGRLAVPPVTLDPGAGSGAGAERQLARRIAAQIAGQLAAGKGGQRPGGG